VVEQTQSVEPRASALLVRGRTAIKCAPPSEALPFHKVGLDSLVQLPKSKVDEQLPHLWVLA
jgi:hypothetical protein